MPGAHVADVVPHGRRQQWQGSGCGSPDTSLSHSIREGAVSAG